MLRPAPCLDPNGPLSPGFSYCCRSGFRVNWQLPWQIPFNLLEFKKNVLLHSASWRSRIYRIKKSPLALTEEIIGCDQQSPSFAKGV
jgi:hypothetical protein